MITQVVQGTSLKLFIPKLPDGPIVFSVKLVVVKKYPYRSNHVKVIVGYFTHSLFLFEQGRGIGIRK